MKPAAFGYFCPKTLEEALGLLERFNSEAKVLAGGQSLVPLMNFRLAQPRYLIDINRISDLSYIREENGSIAFGALVRHTTIEKSGLLTSKCPLLVEATRLIGNTAIRNRGTIGGSLAHADPSAEYPAVVLALDGEVRAMGPRGERVIPARDFFLTFCTTALAANELLTEVRLPVLPPGAGWAFEELTPRYGDYATVGVAAVISLDRQSRCEDVRIALAAVGPTPIRSSDAENRLKGEVPSPERIKVVSKKLADVAQPTGDTHASASYKQAMVAVLVERALRKAVTRVGRDQDAV